MATITTQSAEHRQVARDFLAVSDSEVARGDVLQGAEKFRRHFYHDSMEYWERDADRPLVHDFVERILAVA